MRRSFFACMTMAAGVRQVTALTYWIDGSCTGDRDMDKGVEETISMGSRASARLNSPTDTDFQRVYEMLMKRKKSDTSAFGIIDDFMSDVASMTRADQRRSNVRIYCDQEKRWRPRLDPKTKQRTGVWEDPENWIQYQGRSVYSLPGCLDTWGGNKFTHAQAYHEYMKGQPPVQQADPRMTITFCDLAHFKDAELKEKRNKLLSQLKSTADLSTASEGIDSFKFHVSKILLHELSHFQPYGTIDLAYTWHTNPNGRVMSDLTADELLKNADVRSYLGQLALLADRGYAIQRKPQDGATKAEIAAYEANLKVGKLVKYKDLTRRDTAKMQIERRKRYDTARVGMTHATQ